MHADLPEEFDVIVVGTGLTESLLAAACARAGQRVLHLDSNDHYGSRCSSYGLKQMDAWLRGPPVPPDDDSAVSAEGTVPQPPPPRIAVLTDAPTGVSFMPTGASAEGLPPADMLAQSHRYNIDLTPQLLLCAGEMVGVLRSSGVASYLEFKPVQAHLCGSSSELQRVPCGKADIFQSASISLADKRHLMKFLQSCLALQPQLAPDASLPLQALAAPDAPVEPAAGLEGSFADFLQRQRLSAPLCDVALYAILQLPRPISTRHPGPTAADGVRAVCAHLRSLGQFGPTAYLACYYGSSELPQGFCRLCAVWGGVYMLQQSAVELELESTPAGETPARGASAPRRLGASAPPHPTPHTNPTPPHVPRTAALTSPPLHPCSCTGEQRIAAVVDGAGRRTRCKWLLLNGDNCIEPPAGPAQGAEAAEATSTIARCVCVLDAPLVPSSEEDGILSLSLLFQVPGREAATVYVLQQDQASAVCPAGSVLLHLSADGVAGSTAQEQLEPALQLLREHAAAHRATALTEAAPGTAEAATAEATPATAEAAPAAPGEGDEAKQAASGETPLESESPTGGGAIAEDGVPVATSAPRVLWGAYFSLPVRRPSSQACWANLLYCDDLAVNSSCDAAVAQARGLFAKVCPGEPFLPEREAADDAAADE
jgi:RAB protein geranylgeranyltransferase component A